MNNEIGVRQTDETKDGTVSPDKPALQAENSAEAWRPNGGKTGDRFYRFFGEAYPKLNDEILDKFNVGFGAMILYQDMTEEELGNLLHDAIAIGYVAASEEAKLKSANGATPSDQQAQSLPDTKNQGKTMKLDELREKCAEALREKNREWEEAGKYPSRHSIHLADAVLKAISEANCTIVPDEPTEEMISSGIKTLFTNTRNMYQAMLSSSPFKREDG